MEKQKFIISPATKYDIDWIIDTQIKNHAACLDKEEREKYGFVSLLTPRDYIEKLIDLRYCVHVARFAEGKNTGLSAGYLILVAGLDYQKNSFLKKLHDFSREALNQFENLDFNIITGALVAQVARTTDTDSEGVGTALYGYLFEKVLPQLSDVRYLVTEVSTQNPVSIKFHKKMGFHPVTPYKDDFLNEMLLIMKEVNKKA